VETAENMFLAYIETWLSLTLMRCQE